MKDYRADLHIHSVLSPCGDLDMSPRNIIRHAVRRQIDILGITDHNSTRHGPLMRKLGKEHGVFVLTGAEVTSREEVHCLAFFETDEQLTSFQEYLDKELMPFRNDPGRFGHQVVVDKDDNIVDEVENLLIYSIDQGVDQIEQMVHSLEGLFIPAHVNRAINSILSQLGFMPSGIKADALEISRHVGRKEFLDEHPDLSHFTFIQSSDAHFPEDIGRVFSLFRIKEVNFGEIKMALACKEGRRVVRP